MGFLVLLLFAAFAFLPWGAAKGGEYVVLPGDSLWLIAQEHGLSVEELKKANNLVSNLIYPGQKLFLPTAKKKPSPLKEALQNGDTVWVVRSGDTLWGLSAFFGVPLEAIRSRNGLIGNLIYVGQELIIPSPRSLSPAVAAEAPSPSPPPGWTEEDLYWLARAIHAEAKGEPFEGKVAVGAVILNRVKSPLFPNTIKEVIFQRTGGVYQFSVVADGSIYALPDESALRAAELALRGYDPTHGSLFFYNPWLTSYDNWIRSRHVVRTIGSHNFAV